jgi:hypothetical protein
MSFHTLLYPRAISKAKKYPRPTRNSRAGSHSLLDVSPDKEACHAL